MIAYLVLAALQTAAAPVAPATAAPATAAPTAAVPATTMVATATPQPKQKLICEDEESLGTRLGGHKRCMTKDQWRAEQAQEREAVRHAQDSRGYTHN